MSTLDGALLNCDLDGVSVQVEVEYLCQRVALINAGKKIDEGSPLDLKTKYNAQNLEEVFMEATKIV